jgi:diguanylate cyclase (GGDEF)-like protein
MGHVAIAAELEREEFLTVPPLFKYGPRALLLVGVVIAALAVGAGMWRIHDGLKTGYEAAFADSTSTAAAAKENLGQWLSRLKQTAAYLDSIQQSPHQREQAAAVLHGLAIPGAALSAGGTPLAFTGDAEKTVALAMRSVADERVRGLPRGGQMMLPAMPNARGALQVPVVQRLSERGPVEHVVFLLEEEALSAMVRTTFGVEGGWLHIRDAAGHDVLDIVVPSSRPNVAGKPRERLLTPQQALRGKMDYDSPRLLVGIAPSRPGEAVVSVGLTEAAFLINARKRIVSTWVIVAFVLPVLGSLGMTAFALRRFSTVEEYLRRLARLDVLTGLPNRRRFNSLLRSAVARSTREGSSLALLYNDIDDFKYDNDSLGHSVGDALIQHVGGVLTQMVRPDDHVCRLGGDEFTIIAANLSGPEGAMDLGNRILERLKQAVRIDGVDLRPKASIGIALMPQFAHTEQDLMRFADTAMYRAKNEGKGHCVVYDHSMAAQAVEKAKAIQQLEQGILGEQLFLVYQPKFELATGKLVGHEALVRWNHPQRGLVYPGDFISLAEESGLIGELGNWVLERAVRQIQEWHRQGHGWHRVAINVSVLQMRDDGFVDRVASVLERHGVPGSLLQVEITESTLAADVAKMRAMVRRLRTLGVLVAVDDFGTGYSSLAALQQYDLDLLKVDRSFVLLVHTRQGQAVCRAIITLGHSMGMTVVGEGVETADQAGVLLALGCDQVQGYHFSRPLAADVACLATAIAPRQAAGVKPVLAIPVDGFATAPVPLMP